MGDVRDCFLRSNSEADSDSAWSAIPRKMNQLPKRAGRDDFHLSILRLPFPVSQSPARGLQQEPPTSSSPCVQTQYTMHESSSPVVRPSVHLYTSHPTEVPAHAPFCATSSPPLSSVYTLLRLPYTCLGTRLVPRRTRHSTLVHKARRSPSNSVSSHQRSPRSCSKTCHSGTRSFLENTYTPSGSVPIHRHTQYERTWLIAPVRTVAIVVVHGTPWDLLRPIQTRPCLSTSRGPRHVFRD